MRGGALVVLGLCFASTVCAEDWDPIPESHLSVTAPLVDPDADAEAIFRKVRVFDQTVRRKRQCVREEYRRIKIFTQRGVEQHSTVDLVSSAGRFSIDGLRARTIKPGGRVIELEQSAIFERTAVRAGGIKVNVKAFSMPGVEPGDIIEYRWKRVLEIPVEPYVRFDVEDEIPSWSVSFRIKPNQYANDVLQLSMKCQALNMPESDFSWDQEGFYSAEWENVEAFRPEPRMPPEDHSRRWIRFFYAERPLPYVDPWIRLGVKSYEIVEPLLKVDRAIKKKTAELTAGIASPEDKVKKIREFCLNGIRNIRADRFDMAAEERRNFKINHKPSDILKRSVGQWYEINLLFATLVKAAGIDARLAQCAGRDKIFFDPGSMEESFLDRLHIAVRIGEEWKLYDLSNPYLEEGMLSWEEEGVQSLIWDPIKPVFVRTPYSGPERSRAVRKATLKLLADGSIEGAVEETFFGHLGVARKMTHEDQSAAEREKSVEEAVRLRLGDARVANIRFENVTGSTKPYTVRYDIQVSDYAERTGKRLFLRPAFFRRNVPPEFSASERKHDVYFRYSWSEHDELSIETPPGFELENATAPSSAEHAGTYAYRVALRVTPEKRLLYSRHLRFGENGTILFPVNSYPALKKIFDFIHEMDNHVVALRDTPAGE